MYGRWLWSRDQHEVEKTMPMFSQGMVTPVEKDRLHLFCAILRDTSCPDCTAAVLNKKINVNKLNVQGDDLMQMQKTCSQCVLCCLASASLQNITLSYVIGAVQVKLQSSDLKQQYSGHELPSLTPQAPAAPASPHIRPESERQGLQPSCEWNSRTWSLLYTFSTCKKDPLSL